jgi:uncharacterized membrane protein
MKFLFLSMLAVCVSDAFHMGLGPIRAAKVTCGGGVAQRGKVTFGLANPASADAMRLRGGGNAVMAIGFPTEHAWELFFENGVAFINYFGGLLLLCSVSISLLNTFAWFINRLFGTKLKLFFSFSPGAKAVPVQLTRVKYQLGTIISVALMIMVAADILETMVKPAHKVTIESLYKLVMISCIRTGLAYFLGKEMEELEHKISKHDGVERIVV